MTRRCHFVPVFYLKHFVDIGTNKLWVRDLTEKKTFRASPRDVANSRDYYTGEKARHEDDLEQKLAKIEGDAAAHFRALLKDYPGMPRGVPEEVTRFIAWQAARSEWVRNLPNHYSGSLLERFDELCEAERTSQGRELPFPFRSTSGELVEVPFHKSLQYLQNPDWKWEPSQDQFLDLIRMQAYLFQTKHFASLQWVLLRPPRGRRFITSDRPVNWDIKDFGMHNVPYTLTLTDVNLLFPVGPQLALMAGHNQQKMLASAITPTIFNNRMCQRADRFIYAQHEEDLYDEKRPAVN